MHLVTPAEAVTCSPSSGLLHAQLSFYDCLHLRCSPRLTLKTSLEKGFDLSVCHFQHRVPYWPKFLSQVTCKATTGLYTGSFLPPLSPDHTPISRLPAPTRGNHSKLLNVHLVCVCVFLQNDYHNYMCIFIKVHMCMLYLSFCFLKSWLLSFRVKPHFLYECDESIDTLTRKTCEGK